MAEKKVNELEHIAIQTTQNEDQIQITIRKKWTGKEKKLTANVRNGRGNITKDSTDIISIIRDYYDQLCTKKLNNLDKVDKGFERQKLPKFT